MIKIINSTNLDSENVFCSLSYSSVSNKSRVKLNSYLGPYASVLALHVLVLSLRISGLAKVVSVAMEVDPFHKCQVNRWSHRDISIFRLFYVITCYSQELAPDDLSNPSIFRCAITLSYRKLIF
jgi:hypothetical protein